MEIDKIKKELLNDIDFRKKLFELYYKDEDRFLNKLKREASDN